VKNIRHAFKVKYDSEYAGVDQNMKEYSPEDSEEEDLVANPETFKGPTETEQGKAPLLAGALGDKKPEGEGSKDDL